MEVGAITAQPTDETPVVRAVESFDAFFGREFRAVAALAYTLSGSRLAAEDLAQDAFVAAYRQWTRIAGYDDPGAWVRRVVANRAMSLLRRRSAEARALLRIGRDRHAIPEMSPPAEELWRAVRELPKRQAQAVALHYLEDMSLADIGAVLEISPGTAKAHLHRARRTLAARLGLPTEEAR